MCLRTTQLHEHVTCHVAMLLTTTCLLHQEMLRGTPTQTGCILLHHEAWQLRVIGLDMQIYL